MSATSPISGLEVDIADEAAMVTFAQKLARLLKPVDCITLEGTLGAGKTTLMRALIGALQPDNGQQTAVVSPSFMLMQEYPVRTGDGIDTMLWHMDGYRIEDESEIMELGLEELGENAILCVEWPQMFLEFLPASRLGLNIAIIGTTMRRITFSPEGDWANRIAALKTEGYRGGPTSGN